MDLSYDAFKNGNKKPSKSSATLSYDSFKAQKEKTATTQAQRADLISKGEAVSVNKNKAAPSFVGNIVRSVAKPIATLLVRPGQALASAKGFTPEEQTVKSKYLGDIKTSQNAKDVLKDVGRGFETVSNGVGIGAVKSIGTNVAKQTALQVAKRVAVEGAAAGFIQGVGSGLEQGKTGKDLLWESAKNAGLGGAGGFVLGGAGAKIFGKNATKVADKVDTIAPETNVTKVPTVRRGTNPNPMNADNVPYEPYIPDSQLPVIEMGGKPKSSLPTVQIGEPKPRMIPGDLSYKSFKQATIPTESKITKNVSKDVATKGSNTTTFEKTPTLTQDKAITPNGTEVPRVEIPAPIKAKQTKVLNDIPNEEFQSKSKTAQIDFYNQDPELATKIALGEAPVPEGISRSALHRLASNDATGEAAIRLAESPAPSIYGQNLAMQNIGDRTNSLVDSIKEVLDSRKATMSKKEFKASTDELKAIIRANQPTRQEFEALIKEISC